MIASKASCSFFAAVAIMSMALLSTVSSAPIPDALADKVTGTVAEEVSKVVPKEAAKGGINGVTGKDTYSRSNGPFPNPTLHDVSKTVGGVGKEVFPASMVTEGVKGVKKGAKLP
ncbi:hypothetical protein BGZ76_002624 [Entomortierella beljakovae]|nr:hypothetical protein BGZ76_002624 [Entomortierella beljakovae]